MWFFSFMTIGKASGCCDLQQRGQSLPHSFVCVPYPVTACPQGQPLPWWDGQEELVVPLGTEAVCGGLKPVTRLSLRRNMVTRALPHLLMLGEQAVES